MRDTDDFIIPASIVTVEDSDAVRRSLTLLLRTRGYYVHAFRSGEELLSMRALPRPDCLLIDYRLPGIDGLELLQRLKHRDLVCPAFLTSGYVSPDLSVKAVQAGFVSFVEKPLQQAALLQCIQTTLASDGSHL